MSTAQSPTAPRRTPGRSGAGLGRPTIKQALPFLAVGVVGVVLALLPPYSATRSMPVWAVLVFAAAIAFELIALGRPRRTWVDPVGPWLFFGVIVVLNNATGGSGSGLMALTALPILWLALFGTRNDLWVASGLTVLALGLPIVLVGAPEYPLADWRRVVLWVGIALFVAPVIQHLVRSLNRATRREQEASGQLHALMRGATLSSLVATDLDGNITSFGVGAEKLFALPADRAVGRLRTTDFHETIEVVRAALELGVEPEQVFAELARRDEPSRVWTYLRPDGERRSVRLAVTELRDDTGRPTGLLHVAIDATADIRTQRALEDSEARWRVAMDSLPDTTVMVLDDRLDIHLSSGGGSQRTGAADATGRNLADISNPDNIAMVTAMMAEAAGGRTARRELHSTASGAEQEVLVRSLPHSSAGRRQALLLARDVSAARAREREIAAARDRADRLFADAPHGIALLSRTGTVLRANAALLHLVDRSVEDLVGRALADLGGPADSAIEEHLGELDGGPGRAVLDWSLTTPAGSLVHVALSSTLLRSETGEADEVLVNVTDISERRRHEEQLAHLADHDPLTGLANRRRFSAELTRHVEFCRRYGARGAVLLLDLDHFKEVNDTLGHSVGDQLIVSIAHILQRSVRATDVVARLGGDEFAILLQETDRRGAETVAETVVTQVREHVGTMDGTPRNVTASVGVVVVDEHCGTPTELMASADMTMYDAKDAGRNRWVVLDREQFGRSRTGARMAWATKIEEALAEGDLVLHLQPIWDIRQRRVTGAEALLRLWDDGELVMPSRFLYVAERTDLITRVDAWVIDRSVALLADLQRLDPHFHLEVNVSGRSIGNPLVENALCEALARYDVDPSGLVLEITETAAVADVATARAFAERVTRMGCRFALDDFGAGFGSFYYLKHLLFDYVKIDGEFVSGCHVNPTDRTIVSSIVGIARELGKRTIAEFVSEQAILDVVGEEGADFAQGYHVGRPVPLEVFVRSHLPHIRIA